MQRVQFHCEVCDAKGTIKLADDDMRVEICPCCGSPLEIDYDDDDDE